jgi:hypothetical protein
MSDAGEDGAAATFELERFAWETPDQLELAGRFSGLADVRSDAPVLVVRGERETHRLSAVGEALAWPPEDGEAWSAAFAWSEPPAPFAAAELDLGDGRHLELPEPGARRPRFGRRVLEVRDVDVDVDVDTEPLPAGAVSATDQAEAPEPEPDAPDAPAASAAEPAEPAVVVGLHADLVLAREEGHAAAARAQQAEEELARARADLQAERARRADDAERFAQALAALRETADDALEAERLANAELGNDLRAAHADAQAVQERMAELESSGEHARAAADEARRLAEERDALQVRLEGASRQAAEAADDARRLREERELLQSRLESAERAAVQREGEVERLHERLAGVRRALAEDG